jgi:hypothetical protein
MMDDDKRGQSNVGQYDCAVPALFGRELEPAGEYSGDADVFVEVLPSQGETVDFDSNLSELFVGGSIMIGGMSKSQRNDGKNKGHPFEIPGDEALDARVVACAVVGDSR